jgi:hypothetical protein
LQRGERAMQAAAMIDARLDRVLGDRLVVSDGGLLEVRGCPVNVSDGEVFLLGHAAAFYTVCEKQMRIV